MEYTTEIDGNGNLVQVPVIAPAPQAAPVDPKAALNMYLQKMMSKDPNVAGMAAAQDQAAQGATGLGIAQAGETIGRALAGAAPAQGSFDTYRQANQQRLNDYLAQVKEQRDRDAQGLTAAKMQVDMEPKPVKPSYKETKVKKDGKPYIVEYQEGSPENQKVVGEAITDTSSAGVGRGVMPYGQDEAGNDLVIDKAGKVFMYDPKTSSFSKPATGTGAKRTGIGDTQEKFVAKVAESVKKDLTDVSATEDLSARAEMLLNTGNPNAIPTAATMMATSIQKGVLTDQDFARGAGVPVSILNQGSDAIQKYLLDQPPEVQVKTMRDIINTSKTFSQQKRENVRQVYGQKLDDKGIKVPESQWYVPATAPSTGGSAVDIKAKRAANAAKQAEIKAKLGKQ
jgi:hypothetical protein